MKKDFESSYGLKMVYEATRKMIFPTPDPFLGEAKKVLASPGLWGKLAFLPGSFFLWKETILTSHKFYRSASNRGLRRFWNIVEKFYVTQRILFARSKKRIGRLLGSTKPLKPPLRSEHAFRNVRFAFCVVNVLSFLHLTSLNSHQSRFTQSPQFVGENNSRSSVNMVGCLHLPMLIHGDICWTDKTSVERPYIRRLYAGSYMSLQN